MVMERLVLKYALQNAVFYGGKANPKAILGKVMAENPSLRKDINSVKKEIGRAVSKVNKLKLAQQKKQLKELAPELLEKEVKKQEELSPLKGAVTGKVATRFAPSPTGPLNISQLLRAVMLSYLYAKKYKGLFILRIEDTDPRNIRKEFYEMIKNDIRNAGVRWDKLHLESDDMEEYYKYAEKLVRGNHAYVCTCPAEEFRKLKILGRNCPHRDTGNTLSEWKAMLEGKYKEGEAVFRLRTSMQDPNPALRDPPLLRVIGSPHPLKGRRYRVWPLYNYANTIEDHLQKITHVFRGKEHEHNTEIQKRTYQALGWKPPVTVNFGMVYLPGKKIHTRDVKKWIKEGKVSGWDDVKLHTVMAILRRGFRPEALRQYALQCALTKHDITLDWDSLETFNRKIIDPLANRYMAVFDPVMISISFAPKAKEISIQLHPEFPKKGRKKVPVDPENFFLSGGDFKSFRGKEIRLKGYGNVVLDKEAKYYENMIRKGMQIIQWVSKPNIRVELLSPDGKQEGLGEPALAKLSEGDMVQLERVGFARVDKVRKNKISLYFAHK